MRQRLLACLLGALLASAAACARRPGPPSGNPAPASPAPTPASPAAAAASPVPAGSPRSAALAAWEAARDKRRRRHEAAIATLDTPAFLEPPAQTAEEDFTVAARPPAVDFAILQGLAPEYPPADAKNQGEWGSFGAVTRDGAGRFYFAAGNHLAFGARSYILRYDPAAGRQEVLLDAARLFGWGPADYGDGKLHGDLDVAPDGSCWFLTYFGPRPGPAEWPAYRGGRLARLDAVSGAAQDLGQPLPGASWPYHAWDWRRQVLFAAGQDGQVLVYDTAGRRIIRAGAPPAGISWYNRAVLLDRESGCFYSTASPPVDFNAECRGRQRFVRYDPAADEFRLLAAEAPARPGEELSPGPLRAYAREPDAEGAFWCADFYGTLFRFFPGRERTEYAGVNWGAGEYLANLVLSPGGRYLYYLPGAMWFPDGMPVVQFDTRARRKKVLAFLQAPFLEAYGFVPRRGWGLALTADGGALFFVAQGHFANAADDPPRVMRLALFLLRIPEEERREGQ